jgi:phosphoglycolate phosphatase-like HAD superfamily hydrolase
MNFARSKLGHKILPDLEIHALLGLPVETLMDDLQLPNGERSELVSVFRTELMLMIEKSNDIFPGVVNFLAWAKAEGWALGIATTKPTYLAKMVVENSDLAQFNFYVQGTDGFPAKPEPLVILKCMNYLKVSKAMMFGDRIEDMKAALAAGIHAVGIAASTHSEEQLLHAGAQIAVRDFLSLNSQKDFIRRAFGLSHV